MSENTTKSQKKRERNLPRTAWQKGQSGNPGGRPKDLENVRELARQYTPQAIETLAAIMMTGEKESSRVAAAEALLDRGWGKPVQAMELSSPDGTQVVVMSRDEVERQLRDMGRFPAPRTDDKLPPS